MTVLTAPKGAQAGSVRRARPLGWMSVGLALLGVAVVVGLTAGAAGLPIRPVLWTLLDWIPGVSNRASLQGTDRSILLSLRLPRVVLSILVGGALSIAGGAYQSVFRNPLADPYLLGAAAGAGLGATLVIVNESAFVSWPVDPLPVAAFVGAIGAVALSGMVAATVGTQSGRQGPVLLLAGVAVASFLTSAQTFFQQRQSDSLRKVYSWILGGLTTSGWAEVRLVLPYIAVAVVVLLLAARRLDVLAVGDEEARTLGVSPIRTRLVVVIAASIATGAAVAVGGLIGFVGLVIPHAVRAVAGRANLVVLPLSFLLGGAFVALVDTASRTITAPAELPLGVLTAFIGAPTFAFLLVRQHRRES